MPVKKSRPKMPPMVERIIEWSVGNNFKKYKVVVQHKKTKKTRTINFGDNRYQQYKDLVKPPRYSSKNHLDPKRRRNYFSRHSGIPTKTAALIKEIRKSKGKFTPKILSHKYLW